MEKDDIQYLPHPMMIRHTGEAIDVEKLKQVIELVRRGHEEYYRNKAMGRGFDRKAGCYR